MPKGLTLQQLQTMGAQPVTPTGGKTLAELQGPKQPGLGEKLINDVKETASNIGSRINKGAEALNDSVSGKITAPEAGLRIFGQVVGTGNDLVGGTVKAGLQTANAATGGLAGKAAEGAIQTLAKTPLGAMGISAIKGGLDKWDEFKAKYPRAAQDLEVVPEVAQMLTNFVGGGAVAKGAEVAAPVVKGAAQTAEQLAKNVITKSPEEIKAATGAKLKEVATDWAKPADVNAPSYNKVRAVLDKSPDTPKFLAEQGLNPFSHIEDGKYVTAESADALRNTAAKLSTDTLRPSLQMADYVTPKTSTQEVIKLARQELAAMEGVTPGDKEAIQNMILKEVGALGRKNPEGLGLTEMHDSKILYAKNAGYSPIKSAADNNSAVGNRAIASALQRLVEKKAPEGVPVSDFNQYLSKYYKAADYLDALNDKGAPASTAQLIARGVARFGGAALGAKLGGGIVSEFAGYQLGKALEHAAENLTNPMRASFLSNLEKTNPAAFKAVQEYLSAAKGGNEAIKKLPAGSSIQLPGFNAIKPGPVVPGKSSVKSVPAKKGLPNVNQGTGKFQSTYTSMPEEGL